MNDDDDEPPIKATPRPPKPRFDFKRRRKGRPEDERGGLVVPPKQIIIMSEPYRQDGQWKRDVLFDGVAELEKQYREGGGMKVAFDDGPDDDGSNAGTTGHFTVPKK
jgi:hypothetical protein